MVFFDRLCLYYISISNEKLMKSWESLMFSWDFLTFSWDHKKSGWSVQYICMSYTTLHKGKCKFSFIQSRLVDILSSEITIRTRSKTTFEYIRMCVCNKDLFFFLLLCIQSFHFSFGLANLPSSKKKILFSLFNLMQLVCYLVTRTTFFFALWLKIGAWVF